MVVGLTPRRPPCAAGPFPPASLPLPAAPEVSRLRRDLLIGCAVHRVVSAFKSITYVFTYGLEYGLATCYDNDYMTYIALKLPVQLYHQLQTEAKAQNKTVSGIISAIVQKELVQQRMLSKKRSIRA